MNKKGTNNSQQLDCLTQTLHAINSLIVTENGLFRLIKGACNILSSTRGYFFTWIALFDQNNQLSIIENAGEANGFEKLKADIRAGKLPLPYQEALQNNTISIVTESEQKCVLNLENKNWTSYTSLLQTGNEIHGFLSATVPSKAANNDNEIELFKLFANSVAYAVNNIKEKQDLQSLLASSHEGYILFDNALNIKSVNDALSKLLKQPKEFFIGKSINELVKHYVPKKNYKYVAPALTKIKQGQDLKKIIVHFENKILEFNTCFQNFSKYKLGTIRNVTKEKEEQYLLQKNEIKYRKLVDSLSDSLFIIQEDQIKYVNPALCRVSGYKEEELLNKHFSNFISKSEVDRIVELSKKRLGNQPNEKHYQTVIVTKTGNSIPVEVTTIPTEYESLPALQVILRDISARQKAQQKLLESEERYRFLSESTFEGIVIHDKGRIIDINDKICQLSGYKREELIEASIFDFIYSEDQVKVVKQILKSGITRPYTTQLKRKDNSPVLAQLEAKEILYNGKKVRIVGVKDVTEQQKLTQQLEKTSNTLNNLLNNLPGMAYACQNNKSWDMILMSKECLELTGYHPEEFIEKKTLNFSDLIHPDDRNMVWKTVQDAIEEKGIFELEYRIITKKDDIKWVWERGTQTNVEGKELLEGFITDITKRKLAAKAFFKSETKYRALFNAINDAVIIHTFDPEHIYKLVELNDKACDLYGYSREEMLQLTTNQLIPSIKEEKENALLNENKLLEQPYATYTAKHQKKNGEIIPVEISCRIFEISGKKHITSVIRDITERVETQKQLNNLLIDLSIIFDNDPTFIIYKDINGNIIRITNSVAQSLGLPKEEIEGKSMKDFFPEDADKFHENDLKVIRSGQPLLNYNRSVYYPNGERRWVLTNIIPVKENGKDVSGILIFSSDITKQKQHEKELEEKNQQLEIEKQKLLESEQKFSSFMNFIPGPAFIKDKNGAFLFVNQFMKKNLHASDWVGKNTKDVIPPDQLPNVLHDDKLAFKQGRHKYEEQFQVVDQGNRDFLTYKFTVDMFRNQKLLGGIGIDITERKQLELRDTMLSKAMDSSPVSIVITNKDGSIEYVNPFFENKTGYTFAEVKGKNPRVLKSGKQPETFYKELWETILAGKNWYGEFENKKKNGQAYWEQASISPVANEHGEIIQFIAIKEDITEKKQTLTDLKLAKEKAEKRKLEVIKQKDIIQFHNERLECLFRISQFSTQSTEELLDYALHEVIRLTKSKIGFICLYNKQEKQFVLNTWSAEAMKECSVVNPQTVFDLDKTGCWGESVRQQKPLIINDYEAPNKLKKGIPEGHVKLKKFLTIPVFSADKIVAVAGVANKTEDYNQSDIRQLTLLLDNVWKIAERIKLIEDLKIAKIKAEESDKLKSAFLANMSHEIRTPMNGIIGFTELLRDPDLTGEEHEEFISIIQKSGDRMLSTINNIINIAKIESGLVEIETKEIDLKAFMTEIYLFFNNEAQQKAISLKFINKNDSVPSYIKSDSEKLNSIISNLIKNAIKFTDKGEVAFGYKQTGDELEFFVKDTGIGIPQNRQRAIFERFVQADIDDSRVYEGSGLGLSISKSYTEMLGGSIRVESEEGKGTTFYVSFPQEEKDKKRRNMKVDVNKPSNSLPKDLTILVAEDDLISIELLKRIFKEKCKKLLYAKDGKTTVELARSNPEINLILMDIKMPKMDGYAATQEIRKFNKKVKIIAQTAFAQEPDSIRAFESGCDDFVTKPIDKTNLFLAINKLFNID